MCRHGNNFASRSLLSWNVNFCLSSLWRECFSGPLWIPAFRAEWATLWKQSFNYSNVCNPALDWQCPSNGRGPHSQKLLYGELVKGKRPVGRPKLRFRDVATRDTQAIALPIDSWESLATDRNARKTSCTEALREGERFLHITVDARRERQKARALATSTDSTYVCGSCHRICRSRIGLQSHLRKCLRKCAITNTR